MSKGARARLDLDQQIEVSLELRVPENAIRYLNVTLWPGLRDTLRKCAVNQPQDWDVYLAAQLIRRMDLKQMEAMLEKVHSDQLWLLLEETLARSAPFENTDVDSTLGRGTSKEAVAVANNYSGAFEESGGEQALKAHAKQSRILSHRVNSQNLSGYCDVAMPKPESQRFEYESIPIMQLRENLCQFVLPHFENLCKHLAMVTQGQMLGVPPMSTIHARCRAAVRHGGAFGELTKILRCAIAYKDIPKLYSAMERLVNGSELQRCDTRILSIDDRLQRPADPKGWRDVNLHVRVDGHVCQIRLQLLPLLYCRSGSTTESRLIPFLDDTHLGNDSLMSDLLFLAAARRDENLCQLLLEQEADPRGAYDRNKRTALHCAACHGCDEMCLKLLDPGSFGLSSHAHDACCEDKAGELPFATAFLAGHLGTARLLLHWSIAKKAPLSQNGVAQCKMLVDTVLDKLASQEQFVRECSLEQTAEEEVKIQEYKDVLNDLEEFGYPVQACDRLSTAIALGVKPVISVLAKMGVRDRDGRSSLMLIAETANFSQTLVDCARDLLAELSTEEVELNSKDAHGKTAVDYALEYGQEKIGALLMNCGAVDAQGQDIFSRAVRDNNAHFVQHLWKVIEFESDNSYTGSGLSSGQTSRSKLMLLDSNPGAKGNRVTKVTSCTCFIPTAKCDQGEIRYPLMFADTFPRTKRLTTDPGANKILDFFRKRYMNDKKVGGSSFEHHQGNLTGFNGLDIYNGTIPCWVCEKPHDQNARPAQSWVGPVNLQMPKQAPQVRIFMHHTCAASLEQVLASGKAGQERAMALDKRLWRSQSTPGLNHSNGVAPGMTVPMNQLSPLNHSSGLPEGGGFIKMGRGGKWR